MILAWRFRFDMTQKTAVEQMLNDKRMVVLALLGIVLSWVVFGPVIAKLKSRTDEREKLTKELTKLEDKLEALEGIDEILIEERVKKMEEVFPSKKPVVALMGSLSALSGEHNLSFGGVTLRPGVLGEELSVDKKKNANKKTVSVFPKELKDLRFGFQVAGDFSNLVNFMNDLENLAPLMKIEEIGLTVKSSPYLEGAKISVIADIEVASYYQLPPASLGSVSTPLKLLNREDEAYLNRLFNFKAYEAVIPVAPTGKSDLFSVGHLESPEL